MQLSYIQLRKHFFSTLVHGYGPGKIPTKILRLYWSIAGDRALDHINSYKLNMAA
jgi:hypothetical protein